MYLEQLKLLNSKKAGVVIAIILISLLIFLYCCLYIGKQNDINQSVNNSYKETDNQLILSLQSFSSSLADISSKLNNIETQLLKSSAPITPIQEQISSLSQETENLYKDSKDHISNSISGATNDLKAKLSVIEGGLSELKERQKQVTYIKPENLPFNTLHIDNIQGNSVTTIRYNNTIFPITEGESLAGWKLIKSVFNEQKAEFVNDRDEHILITLQSTINNNGAAQG